MTSTGKVAVVQAAPVVFDRERTIDKLHSLTGEAAQQGAELVLFPEAFVSSQETLRDLQILFRYGPDPSDLPVLAHAAEGLAISLGDSEGAFELAAEIAARRAELAD